jgi:peptidoglycan/LPS O-acetylase OafA/YrhL
VRALAIVPVVLFHTALSRHIPGGAAGVDLFFVLSGFLITTILLEEWARDGRVDVGAFYVRRALRLGPAMLALLLFAWVATLAGWGTAMTARAMTSFTVYVLTYTANWVLAHQTMAWPPMLGHLWSLAVEEQFYLVWPWLLVLVLRGGLRLRHAIALLLVTIAALALWRAIHWHRHHDLYRVLYSTDMRAGGLLFGGAVAAFRRLGWRVSRPLAFTLAAAGVLLCAYSFLFVDKLRAYPLLGGLQPVELGGGMLVFALATGACGPLQRLLEARPLLWLGRRSYGIYLWHLPALYLASEALPGARVLATFVGVAVALPVAELSYRYVEQPALRLKARRAARGGAVPPVAAAA